MRPTLLCSELSPESNATGILKIGEVLLFSQILSLAEKAGFATVCNSVSRDRARCHVCASASSADTRRG